MTEPTVLCAVDGRGVATLTLNRPAVHNAYDGAMMEELGAALSALRGDGVLRAVVLASEAKHFCAGADLGWLRAGVDEDAAAKLALARLTTGTMRALHEFPRPTVALVHGACYGGGTGFVAACDIAIAAEDAVFAITEVRVGVVHTPIAPELDAAIGARAARRYALTGERFDAAEARRIGLVHEVVPRPELAAAGARVVAALLAGGPAAVAAAKALIFDVAGLWVGDEGADGLARRAAAQRASAEMREGLDAFLGRRRPAWAGD